MTPDTPSANPAALTHGIRVSVETRFMEERSGPKFFSAYRTTIADESDDAAQLRTRHWMITDASGRVKEVEGDGVIDEQPRIEPGSAHQHTSFCALESPRGSMHGSYRMLCDDGTCFDVEIPPFAFVAPVPVANQFVN